MSDQHRTGVPPSPVPSAPPPPPRRHPVLTVLMVIVGIILLLPGLCALIVLNLLPGRIAYEEQMLIAGCVVAAIAGIALIVWALRKRRVN
jgi:hypothetical protein